MISKDKTVLQEEFNEARQKLIAAILKFKRAKRIEYVESNKKQRIDTRLPTGPNTRTETDISVEYGDSHNNYVLNGSGVNRHVFGRGWIDQSNPKKDRLYFGLGDVNFSTDIQLSDITEQRHVYWIDAPSKTAGCDDISFDIPATTIGTNRFVNSLFVQRQSAEPDSGRGFMAAKLYGFKHYENGRLVIDLIPVKDRNGAAGLLDVVSGEILYSTTSTPLIAGPGIYDAEIEYLESSGTQFIDTGLGMNVGDIGEIEFQFLDISTPQQRLFRQHPNEISQRGKSLSFQVYLNGACKFAYSYSYPAVSYSAALGPDPTNEKTRFALGGTPSMITLGNYIERTKQRVDGTPELDGRLTLIGGAYTTNAIGRLYSAKIIKHGVVVRDFIPVRKGLVGYFYDKITGMLFGNKGTGDFVLGPDVVSI